MGAKTVLVGALRFLRAHPVVCVALLSPGIPEYISGSSPISFLVLNPVLFMVSLALNLGLYVPGVLLIREAMVRWRKGWASVLLLGGAYGILEEGIALSTLFNPKFTLYGRWLGVNWISTVTILPVHMIYSIALPILLLGLALPETRGRSLLSPRGVWLAIFVLCGDVVLLMYDLVSTGFWMGWAVFAAGVTAIMFLVWLARAAPQGALRARSRNPTVSPFIATIVGLPYYFLLLPLFFFAEAGGIPASIDLFLVVGVQALFLTWAVRSLGSSDGGPTIIAFAFGLVLSSAVFGVLVQLTFPLVLLADGVMILFFMALRRRHSPDLPSPAAPSQTSVGQEAPVFTFVSFEKPIHERAFVFT